MARLVSTDVVQDLFATIMTHHTDGSNDERVMRVGDVVENLRYVENNAIQKVTGRVKAFSVFVKRYAKVSSNNKDIEDTFSNDVELNSITLDCSTEYNSNVITIDAREIIEDEGVENVVYVTTKLTLHATLKQLYSNNTTVSTKLIPGEILSNVRLMPTKKGSDDTVGTYTFAKFLYARDSSSKTGLRITYAVLTDPDNVYTIPLTRVVTIGGVIESANDVSDVTSAIEGDAVGIKLSNIVYNDPITLGKEFTLAGENYGVAANTGSRATSEDINSTETVINNTITINEGGKVIIDGVTFTDKAFINITDADYVIIKNCRFVNMSPATAREYLIKGNPGNGTPTNLSIENCYFGDYDATNGRIYNLFELACKLSAMSYIINNKFTRNVCSHNIINIYNVTDNSIIEIENNSFDYSANAIRIGIKGEPTCSIRVTNNIYFDTDKDDPEYAGLLLIQPYGRATTSFKNCEVIMLRNTNKTKIPQMWYFYCGPEDAQIDEYNVPTVMLNNKIVMSAKEA